MKKTVEIELTERDVRDAIGHYVWVRHSLKVKSISFSTGVRGDYDRGDAEEYVRSVICECVDNKKK